MVASMFIHVQYVVRDVCEARDVLGSRRGPSVICMRDAPQRAWQHVVGDAEKNGAIQRREP
jgi:hypothetical protein